MSNTLNKYSKTTTHSYLFTSSNLSLFSTICPLLPSSNGVNFTNILWPAFSYKSVLSSFFVLTVWLCILLAKNIGAKAAHKMLMKLTPKYLFRNVWGNLLTFKQTYLAVVTDSRVSDTADGPGRGRALG